MFSTMRFIDVLTLSISICSLLSSGLYTYVYVVGQQATFFNEIHSEYATPEMRQAFDILEGFLSATGPKTYGSEYVRLKRLQRETYRIGKDSEGKNVLARLFMPSLREDVRSDAEIGHALDKSRRHIMHYFGKLLMFNRLGYITGDMMREFPGRTRALHAVQLLKPLVEETSIAFNYPGLEEHFRVLEDVRNVYNISNVEASIYASTSDEVCTNDKCSESTEDHGAEQGSA